MVKDKKQVIDRNQYGRKRREFFHNEEREARVRAQEERSKQRAEKEQKQVKNNEERVKDNLRKARVEKITHNKKGKNVKNHNTKITESSDTPVSSVHTKSEKVDAKQQDALHETADKHQTEHEANQHHETPEYKFRTKDYDTHEKKDKEPDFAKKHWPKILIGAIIILLLLIIWSIFNSVDKDNKVEQQQTASVTAINENPTQETTTDAIRFNKSESNVVAFIPNLTQDKTLLDQKLIS